MWLSDGALRKRRRRRWPVALAVAAVLADTLGAGGLLSGQPALGPVSGHSQAFPGTSAVGALFMVTHSHRLGRHFCTASVVDSPGRDMLITAAHCVTGTPASAMAFLPGYHDGKAPYGVWPITHVAVDRMWSATADPDDDVAFLITAKPGPKVQDVTGGERLGMGTAATGMVRVVGYPVSANDPVRCDNRVAGFSATQLRFECGGYSMGTSGSALLTEVSPSTGLGTVIGVIGGYEQGGNTADVSYAARFGPRITDLYHAAATTHT